MENQVTSAPPKKIKLNFKDSKYATGRRKKSIAKIWLKKGTGKIYVNGRTMDDYFSSGAHKMQITRPFEIIKQATSYDVRCNVAGGGHTGQAGAMVHGIAKALILFDADKRPYQLRWSFSGNPPFYSDSVGPISIDLVVD